MSLKRDFGSFSGSFPWDAFNPQDGDMMEVPDPKRAKAHSDSLNHITMRNEPTTEFDEAWLQDENGTIELCSIADNTLAPSGAKGATQSTYQPTVCKSSNITTSGADSTSFTNTSLSLGFIAGPAIVRVPFPAPIRDRSPIIGLSSSTLLRTCFRVGEAINCGCDAIRRGVNVIIELYARVASSYREVDEALLGKMDGKGTGWNGKQHFVFRDLFHDNPPLLEGCYELGKGCSLWDDDSSVFLEEDASVRARGGKMCRVMGQMTRERRKWKFVVLNIWEAGWEDVEFVKGIVCA